MENWGHWGATAQPNQGHREHQELPPGSRARASTRAVTKHRGLGPGVGTDTRPWQGCGAGHRVGTGQPRHPVWQHNVAWGGPGEGEGTLVTAAPMIGGTAGHPVTSPRPIPGVDFKMKTIEVDGIKVRIQIW